MKQVKLLAALGLMGLAGAANAGVSSTVAIVSDYDFRGVTQTLNKPALQGSIDFATDSGWYVGTWASNVDFGVSVPQTETDIYTGFKLAAGDVNFDFGVIYYAYNGDSDLNFGEIYGKASYKIVSASLYYSNDFGGKAFGTNSDDALYLSTDLAIPMGPLSLGVHAGLSNGDGILATYGVGTEDSYIDYGLGLSYSSDNFTFGIKWVGKDFDVVSDDRILLSFSTAFPFAK
jgi:uncharacterized protein (TIGR02001 family)